MQTLRSRWQALDPLRIDIAIAVFLLLLSVVEAFAILGRSGPETIASVAIGGAGYMTLIVRRTRPYLAPIVIPVTGAIAGTIATPYFAEMAAPFLAAILAIYSLGRYGRPEITLPVAVLSLAGMAIADAVLGEAADPAQLLWLAVLGGGAYAVGRVFHSRARLRRELRARMAELERDGAARAESAVEAERARIAAELQAAVANGVSAMVIQAEAIPRVLADDRTEDAEAAFNVIEETGRDALAEMRRLLGVLRRDDDGPSLAPQPTMGEVERLVESLGDRGLVVVLELEGDRVALGPGADLAAYRVLQDALAAAADMGAESATVVVGFDPGELRLDVRDDREDARVDPEPLLAMRERLGLYGGRVKAEALAGGGFRIVARLPMTRAAA